jgi:nucleotide-binding universal stress UspA family protein
MISIKKILASTDFSQDSNVAVHYAAQMAPQFGATLYLIHVVEAGEAMTDANPAAQRPPLPPTAGVHEAREQLQQLQDEMADVKTVIEVRLGSAADGIVAFAREEKADVVVMATHGRRGLARMFLGSTTEQVIRQADCPVISLRHPKKYLTGRAVEASRAQANT